MMSPIQNIIKTVNPAIRPCAYALMSLVVLGTSAHASTGFGIGTCAGCGTSVSMGVALFRLLMSTLMLFGFGITVAGVFRLRDTAESMEKPGACFHSYHGAMWRLAIGLVCMGMAMGIPYGRSTLMENSMQTSVFS